MRLRRACSKQPDIGVCVKQSRVKATGGLVKARRKTTRQFDSVEDPLDEVPRLVGNPVGRALARAIAPLRQDPPHVRVFNGFAQRVSVIPLVADFRPGRIGGRQRGPP